MDAFTNKFSFKEFVEILIPGIYTAWLALGTEKLFGSEFIHGIVFFLTAIGIGVFLSALSLPALILKRSNMLSTEILMKNMCGVSKKKPGMTDTAKNYFQELSNCDKCKAVIYNHFFRFYDHKENIPQTQQTTTEVYTGFFYMAVNTAFISFIALCSYIFSYEPPISQLFLAIILLFSMVAAISFFRKIKFLYYRQYLAFRESEEYKSLLEKFPACPKVPSPSSIL